MDLITNDIRKKIKDLLRDTKREGIEDLIAYMDQIGFYKAPASTRFHGSYEGALAIHSYNVYLNARVIADSLTDSNWVNDHMDSIVICSILHDLGKCGQFGKPLYTENILKNGNQSEAQPYKHNPDLMDLPHEITSVIEIQKFIKLTEEEQRAIAWHNGLYGIFKYEIQGKEDELYMIIHWADMWASRITEKEDKE